jgi:hypothetical protein
LKKCIQSIFYSIVLLIVTDDQNISGRKENEQTPASGEIF